MVKANQAEWDEIVRGAIDLPTTSETLREEVPVTMRLQFASDTAVSRVSSRSPQGEEVMNLVVGENILEDGDQFVQFAETAGIYEVRNDEPVLIRSLEDVPTFSNILVEKGQYANQQIIIKPNLESGESDAVPASMLRLLLQVPTRRVS